MSYIPCTECKISVDLNSNDYWSPNGGIDVYHGQCFIKVQGSTICTLQKVRDNLTRGLERVRDNGSEHGGPCIHSCSVIAVDTLEGRDE